MPRRFIKNLQKDHRMVYKINPFPNKSLTYEDLSHVLRCVYASILPLENGSLADAKDYFRALKALDTIARRHKLRSTFTMQNSHELVLTPREVLRVLAEYLPAFGISTDGIHADCYKSLYVSLFSIFSRYGARDCKNSELVAPLSNMKLSDLVEGHKNAGFN